MSAWKKATSSLRRNHHERSQPAHRKNLGMLEKKKDWKRRADGYKERKRVFDELQEAAAMRNPDEFSFEMINSKLTQDGRIHYERRKKEMTQKQQAKERRRKAKRVQNKIAYVNMNRQIERKSIQGLQDSLGFISSTTPSNKHTIFLDSKDDLERFDPAEHFDTVPEMVDRRYNRLKKNQLRQGNILRDGKGKKPTPEAVDEICDSIDGTYEQLRRRLIREKQIDGILDRLQEKKNIMEDSTFEKVKVKKRKRDTPPDNEESSEYSDEEEKETIVRWKSIRKR